MQIIKDAIAKIVDDSKYQLDSFVVEHPKDESNGDYACNVALILAKKMGKNPREVANEIVKECQKNKELMNITEKIEVAGHGFINFYLKESFLWEVVKKVNEEKENFGKNQINKGKKIIVEYTDPNPFKEMHIGHLMSNTIGESIARLKESEGAEVKRANYQGDIGLHVAKGVWGMRKLFEEDGTSLEEIAKYELTKRQQFMGRAYAYGATKFEEDEIAKQEIHALNKEIYVGSDPLLMEQYRLGREWSLEYFETIYQRLGTKFDEYFFESLTGKVGLKVVNEGLEKGVLEIGEDGAIVYKGEKDGLHTRVFRNKLGLPTYEAKDLGLAIAKWERYPYDWSVIVTANEITEYFKVVLSVMEKLYPDLRAKTVHKPHGVMKLPTGKMSSRTGKVVTAESLLNDLRDVVLTKMGERSIENKELVADQIAVGSLKYAVLKQAVGGDIIYDPQVMTNMEGDTGAYIQYAYARSMSVVEKSKKQVELEEVKDRNEDNSSEVSLLRYVYRFPEVVSASASNFAPHIVCNYLNELASRFNKFYGNCRIADAAFGEREQRLILTMATAQVIRNGLNILGIAAPSEM